MKKIALSLLVVMMTTVGVFAQKVNTMNPTQLKASATTEMDAIYLPKELVGLDAPFLDVLKNRQTNREMMEEDLSMETMASLLWAAYGINRPEEGKRTVPSAINAQEFDVYLFTRDGVYLYNAERNLLSVVAKGDHRAKISSQKFFAIAPVSIVLVANYQRMKAFKDKEMRDFYAAVDCGYISQNIYLYCASAKLATVACGGIDRDELSKLLNIKSGRALLAHPVSRAQ